MNINKIKNIIWDWNGTLLNDVDLCINCMNQLLKSRTLPLLNRNRYQEVFTFPVQDYYESIGIDFEKDPFDIIGHQFMELYFNGFSSCKLHEEAISILEYFKCQGKKQFILSAMEQNALEKSLGDLKIFDYFEDIFGIDNHLAAGKTQRAFQMMNEHQLKSQDSVLIGDTLHDFEVARELNIKALLVASGHQDKERLSGAGVPVYNDLEELRNSFR